ncbi:MAG: hypothetical protein GY953_20495, partial [bacterium]|nr:hypothetical protein [bacterium]
MARSDVPTLQATRRMVRHMREDDVALHRNVNYSADREVGAAATIRRALTLRQVGMDQLEESAPAGGAVSAAESDRRPEIWLPFLLTLAAAACYYSPGLCGDDVQQHFAYYRHGFERLLRGEVAAWNPFVAGGVPWQAE